MDRPRFFHIRIKDLEHRLVKHGIDQDQAKAQAMRSTEMLLQYDPDDPIRGDAYFVGDEDPADPARGLRLMGGHHRLNELYERFRRGELDGDIVINVQHETWDYEQ